jgi:hypothetical protein
MVAFWDAAILLDMDAAENLKVTPLLRSVPDWNNPVADRRRSLA